MAYQLQQFSGDRLVASCQRDCLILNPSEKIKIERVRRFLLDNLAAPVKLDDLVSIAGMSHPKLNRCFRQLYGRTVFEFLRAERLLKARELIDIQGRTVTEAAYMAGYSSLSHFSKVYRQYFGVSPAPGTRRKKRA
nr:AraC family transcriptional regulator [Prosthecochloris ethylica]